MTTCATPPSYQGFRFPQESSSHAVWLYFRFNLSYRDVEELLAARGVSVTYETVRQGRLKFGQHLANQLRRRRARLGGKWHCDDIFLKLNAKQQYLRRAVDQHGNVLDILVQSRRNKAAAIKVFRKLLKGYRYVPRVLITHKFASDGAAKREVLRSEDHRRSRSLNNRAETSHQPTRKRERGYPPGVVALSVSRTRSTVPVSLCPRDTPNPRALLSAPTSGCPQGKGAGIPCSTYAAIPGLERGNWSLGDSVKLWQMRRFCVLDTFSSLSY